MMDMMLEIGFLGLKLLRYVLGKFKQVRTIFFILGPFLKYLKICYIA